MTQHGDDPAATRRAERPGLHLATVLPPEVTGKRELPRDRTQAILEAPSRWGRC